MNYEVYFSEIVSPICLDLTGNSSKLGIEKKSKKAYQENLFVGGSIGR
jgi:hypothetical protein